MHSPPLARIRRRLQISGLLASALILTACATTRQTGSVETTGFLSDYTQLRPGEEGEAQLVYVNHAADFSGYSAIMIDPVTLWRTEETAKVSREDQQALTDHLYAALHEQLAKDFEIADSPGPGVMRLRAAITEAKGAKVVANVVTSVVPQLRMLATAGGLATDTAVLVGKAGVEAEMLDSVTDVRLLAAVDARVGTKAVRGGVGKWSDVRQAFDFWAQRLHQRLMELRSR